jgi:Domain of unknown function (DUF1918)
MPAKKTTTKKTTTKKAAAKKTVSKKTTTKKTTTKEAAKSAVMKPKRGDIIVIDSAVVGSPKREGEVLKIMHGDVSVSYRVKWADGHETLISPAAGSVSFVRP